jgi:hypothetical protein
MIICICSLKQMLALYMLYESKWFETYDQTLDPGERFGDTSPTVLLQLLVLTHKLGCTWLHHAVPSFPLLETKRTCEVEASVKAVPLQKPCKGHFQIS